MLAGVIGMAQAKSAEDVRKTAEAGMLVTGTVEMNPNGSLHGYVLDKPEKLPAAVVDVVGRTVQSWEFRLSGTATDVVTSRMSLRVGLDGTVQEAIAEQVNLDPYDREASMDRYRKILADASLEATRQWTFNTPTKGPEVVDPYWVVRVPVNFNLRAWGGPPPTPSYGQWRAYIPGPRQTPPWIGKVLANESPDAMSDGELRTGDTRLQLVTPVGDA